MFLNYALVKKKKQKNNHKNENLAQNKNMMSYIFGMPQALSKKKIMSFFYERMPNFDWIKADDFRLN